MPAVLQRVIAEAAHALGFVPFAWVALRREQERAYWWLAIAFGVSGIADTVAHWYDPWAMGFVYSVLQVSLIGFVLLWRNEGLAFATGVTLVGLLAVWWGNNITFLLSVAWLGVVGIAWQRPALGMLREALIVYFGVGWVAWLLFIEQGTLESWALYQVTRFVGTLCFCVAVTQPRPLLRVA